MAVFYFLSHTSLKITGSENSFVLFLSFLLFSFYFFLRSVDLLQQIFWANFDINIFILAYSFITQTQTSLC